MTTIIPTAEPESYLHTVENWILSAVKGGRTSFSEILGSLPGVYPPIAFSSLQGLVSQENKLISQELLALNCRYLTPWTMIGDFTMLLSDCFSTDVRRYRMETR